MQRHGGRLSTREQCEPRDTVSNCGEVTSPVRNRSRRSPLPSQQGGHHCCDRNCSKRGLRPVRSAREMQPSPAQPYTSSTGPLHPAPPPPCTPCWSPLPLSSAAPTVVLWEHGALFPEALQYHDVIIKTQRAAGRSGTSRRFWQLPFPLPFLVLLRPVLLAGGRLGTEHISKQTAAPGAVTAAERGLQ